MRVSIAYHGAMDIKTLIKKAGGPAAVARACGITSQAVSQWKRVPPQHCIAIERATSGAIARSDLRPDIWPEQESSKEARNAA
jgi:DNA-binding transcriptional regulator YdaS (Cro superfamily)